MLTKNEVAALNLSPTKKDFVQIWNELLEVAGKLSERWDPTSTNESDPGIVLLKALTGIADKLNYNIDKNILEAFMPTAAQEDSMRKLCDMLGYNMKYYRSAVTDVIIKYNKPAEVSQEEYDRMNTLGLSIPKFTVITNSDQDISYFTLNQTDISEASPVTQPITCMEGQIVKCEGANNSNIITVNQISEANRFYLPEVQVAENGIFVYNVVATNEYTSTSLKDGSPWTAVDNLNTQARGTRVFKFGFDSYEGRPYIEFPEDYSTLFNDGIFIYYTRTSGINGNVSPRTLTRLELPSSDGWNAVSAENFSVENINPATTGANIESIRQAYTNFKKTVGTFETLVTCRDYMNKIYMLTKSNGRPFVSNILVTDIRSDLNRAVTICSCDDAGIFYKETPIVLDGAPEDYAIDYFDLIFYPFKAYNQVKSNATDVKTVYDASFSYAGDSTVYDIQSALDDYGIKSIAHNIRTPKSDVKDIISINNYLRLVITVATNSKVTTEEAASIKNSIKVALANAFNMRELDFGEEIPFDSIIEVVEKADNRIKVASINEPALYTTFSVLETDEVTNSLRTTEYAVASDWLDVDTAKSTGRFTNDTFNSKVAKELYNRLAVRNILAGRVPLFDYNNTFKTSFSEGAFRVTERLKTEEDLPNGLLKPYLAEPFTPFTIWTEGDIIYTGQCEVLPEKPDILAVPTTEQPVTTATDESGFVYAGILPKAIVGSNAGATAEEDDDIPSTDNAGATSEEIPVYYKTTYTRTFTPEDIKDNLISGESTADSVSYITDIKAKCEIPADEANRIKDVTLADGEYVQFRAPNFITTKTYPAYVNYHLDLAGASEIAKAAEAAEATSLFELLNSDRTVNSGENCNWQRVLDFFDETEYKEYKKKFTIQQTISAYKVSDGTQSAPETSEIIINIDNSTTDSSEYTVEELMLLSGCVKLANEKTNSGFKARLTWAPNTEKGETKPLDNSEGPDLGGVMLAFSDPTPFVTDLAILTQIKESTQATIANYRDSGKLPTECSWTVSYDFECVPFEAKSLNAWADFIKTHASGLVAGFEPVVENDIVFWRKFGEGYSIGKYVTEDTKKLLRFDANYFDYLPSTRIHGIYLIKAFGVDLLPTVIANNEEYQLKNNERLYIEYAPSTTLDDGDAKTETVTEVYGEGTIFRPSGFETGILDSSVYASQGNTETKQVTFNNTNAPVKMYSLGANEQIEIREPANVVLDKNALGGSSSIWLYKNFNGVSALEDYRATNKSYILKDGEYIFYTDQNKAEFAYFTNGTEVILHGNVVLPKFEVIELSDIFSKGIQEIPWAMVTFSGSDSIEFQEYQYITLCANDTLKNLYLTNPDSDNCLKADWQECDNVQYAFAEEPSRVRELPEINLNSKTSWKASSVLELMASSDYKQTLRNTSKVHDSLELTRYITSKDGDRQSAPPLIIPADISNSSTLGNNTLSFKTNLTCFGCGNSINIADVLSNPNKVDSFQIKVFAENTPAIVDTTPGKVIPYRPSSLIDIATWSGDEKVSKNSKGSWNKLNLEKIRVASSPGNAPDKALQLSVCVLPDTYGVFSIYVKYSNVGASSRPKTWLEVLPGTSHNDITLINVKDEDVLWEAGVTELNTPDKLILNEGINCIRVNKNCKVFLKTDSHAKGVVWFDELRLVNSRAIEYTDSNKHTVTDYTKGLNLTQLGYMDIDADNNENTLDVAAKEHLKEVYANKACVSLKNEQRRQANDLTACYSTLMSEKTKLSELVRAEEAIEKDLTLLNASNIDDFEKIAKAYTDVSATLAKENSLLKALNNSKSADDLEASLAELSKSLELPDEAGQLILASLLEMKEQILANTKKLDKEKIINDFNHFNQSIDKADTIVHDAIKRQVSNSVYEYYKDQLAMVANDLAHATNPETGAQLLTLLQNIQTAEDLEHLIAINSKVTELSSLVNRDVDSVMEEIMLYAAEPNYKQLVYMLAQLRNLVDSTRLESVIEELIQATADGSKDQLQSIINPFFKDDGINTEKLNAFVNTVLVTKIDDAYNKVKAALADNPDGDVKDATVTKAIEDIQKALTDDYRAKLEGLFNAIKALLDNIHSNIIITDLINALGSYNNSLSKYPLDLAMQVIAEHDRHINGASGASGLLEFSNFDDWEKNTCSSFIEEAIVTLWPERILTRVTDVLTSVGYIFTGVINGDITYQDGKDGIVAIFADLPLQLLDIVQKADIKKLFESTAPIANVITQSKTDIETINYISGLIPQSSELQEAIQAIQTLGAEGVGIGNIVVSKLLEAHENATSAVQKQKIIAELKETLSNAIIVNEQLLSVVSNLLWPGIALIEANSVFREDPFYANLLDEISAVKEKILNNSFNNLSITVDDVYETLFALSEPNFNESVIDFDMRDSLLPKELLNKLLAYKAMVLAHSALDEVVNEMIDSLQESEALEAAVIERLLHADTELPSTIKKILTDLLEEITTLDGQKVISEEYLKEYRTLELEKRLLNEIMSADVNRSFYYTVPIDDSLAIEFNESSKELNTLLNPQFNYDINNVNNNFVISKLDIDYLDQGIQIARSSRYN